MYASALWGTLGNNNDYSYKRHEKRTKVIELPLVNGRAITLPIAARHKGGFYSFDSRVQYISGLIPCKC